MTNSGFLRYRDKGIGLTRDELRALWEERENEADREELLATLATLGDQDVREMYADKEFEIMDDRISALLDELKTTAIHCPAVGLPPWNAPTVFVITIASRTDGEWSW